MRHLSKSKLISFRQCLKLLWLEIHKPELRDDSSSEQVFAIGNEVGRVAMNIYNTTGDGVEIDIHELGFQAAFEKSSELLREIDKPIFEAGVRVAGGLALADVMVPVEHSAWKMVEVKSSTELKDYHRDDAAIQSYLFEEAQVPLDSVSVAHINRDFVYPGGGNYNGLLHENDLTDEVRGRRGEVKDWIRDAQTTADLDDEPTIACGDQCTSPFDCPFIAHCTRDDYKPTLPVSILPRIRSSKINDLNQRGIFELEDVPDHEINERQKLVKDFTLSNEVFFDQEATASELAQYGWPAYFLDFETSNAVVPVWAGTRPYQQIPFQFSVHVLQENGLLTQETFLDISGDDPRLGFAEALIEQCRNEGPVFVYNAAFENRIISELATAFPQLSGQLLAISARVVDLLPLARNHYYHPSQRGSWSIKAVLPAISPDLNYEALEGVKDGGMAMVAFQEAISPDCTPERKTEIYEQLDKYCELDTLAMVRIWEVFSGRSEN